MRLPSYALPIITGLVQRYPGLAQSRNDDDRRELTQRIAQTLKKRSSDPSWGLKKADAGRPVSKDSLVYQSPGMPMLFWDWQNGATLGLSDLVLSQGNGVELDPPHVFVPVEALDWLESVPVPPSEPPPQTVPTVPSPGLEDLEQRLFRAVELLERQESAIAELNRKLAEAEEANERRYTDIVNNVLAQGAAVTRAMPRQFRSNRLPLIGTLTLAAE